jgi:uncharacterized membrane protein HdeD (DUF308 family)
MDEFTQTAMSGGKHITTFGVIAIILGILAMLAPGVTGLSLSILLGLFVTAGGILRITWAFGASSLGKGLLTFALGTMTLLCGLVLLANPVIGSAVLTILLTLYFILDGIFEITAGFTLTGGVWLVFAGTISILLGVMIWAQYPLSGAWAMGTLLGIKLFLVGLVMIASGSAVRSLATA